MNQKKLNEFQSGDPIDLYLMLTKIEIKTARTGKEYLNLELRDKSTPISAKLWDNFSNLISNAKPGSVVKINGLLEEFQGQPQIKINSIRITNNEDEVSFEDFLPKSKRDLKLMRKEFSDVMKSIKNDYLQKLLQQVFQGEALAKYERMPAGKSWHHAYVHGLLEHTLEIIRICELVATFHPEIKRDLLIAGALLHDFGKTEELSLDANFDYTDKGKLLGHIVIAASLVESEASKIANFPEELKNQLIHLILSHQGKLEYASPIEPKTLEAIVLYHADELSAKTNAYKSAIEMDDNGANTWTRYLPLAGTALFIPPKSDDQIKESLFDT